MPEKSFDGCSRVCRTSGQHTYTWGMCEHAPEPEPRLTVARHVIADDGYPSIAMESIPLAELSSRMAEAIDAVWTTEQEFDADRAAKAALSVLRAPHSPAEPVSPVSTPTEAHGETGEAQEGSHG